MDLKQTIKKVDEKIDEKIKAKRWKKLSGVVVKTSLITLASLLLLCLLPKFLIEKIILVPIVILAIASFYLMIYQLYDFLFERFKIISLISKSAALSKKIFLVTVCNVLKFIFWILTTIFILFFVKFSLLSALTTNKILLRIDQEGESDIDGLGLWWYVLTSEIFVNWLLISTIVLIPLIFSVIYTLAKKYVYLTPIPFWTFKILWPLFVAIFAIPNFIVALWGN